MKKIRFFLRTGGIIDYTGSDLYVKVHDKFAWVRENDENKFVAAVNNDDILEIRDVSEEE